MTLSMVKLVALSYRHRNPPANIWTKNLLKTRIFKFYRHCLTAELTSGRATIHRRYLFHLLPNIYQITLSLSSCLLNVYQITQTHAFDVSSSAPSIAFPLKQHPHSFLFGVCWLCKYFRISLSPPFFSFTALHFF